MTLFAILTSKATRWKLCQISPLFVAIFFLSSLTGTISSNANAQDTTIVEIGSGTLDNETADHPRWTRVNFDPLISGSHTIRVSWDSSADIRFSIFQVQGRVKIHTTSSTPSPSEWTGILDSAEQYFLGVWAASGSANFVATVEAVVIDSTPLEIAIQPSDITVLDGDDATFTVVAAGSGTISYQWSANGVAISDATDSTLIREMVTIADTGSTYTVDISDDNGSITSATAVLTVDMPLEITSQPANLTVLEGDDATFTVVANGSGTLTYQWLADDLAIPGAIDSTLTIGAAAASASGTNYSVLISDNNGSIASASAQLTVDTPLAIITQPADLIVTEGEDAAFTVVATGSGTLSYQWSANGNAIPGATDSTLIIQSVPIEATGTTYMVQINDNHSVGYVNATLTVEATPLEILIQPTDQDVVEGDDAIFAVSATGSGALSYQWSANGGAIPGALDSTLTIEAPGIEVSGTTYSVDVSDDNGSVTSTSALLTVDMPLVISTQPVGLTLIEGDDAIFNVDASGSGTLSYQWSANGIAIVDATDSSLLVETVTLDANSTTYSVEITDDNGSLTSNNAILIVNEIILPVTIANIGQGTLDSEKVIWPRWVRLDFDALSTATHTITVTWDLDATADLRFNVRETDGTMISSTIKGTNPGVWSGDLNANEHYYIALWSANGIANFTATIAATVPVSIESQPASLIVTEGDDATFAVEATGSGTLSYQWLADGTPLSGETSDSLTVFSTSLNDNEVEYAVEVSNGVETTLSDVATLTVNAPLILGLFSQEADTSTWVLDGPAPTLDYQANENSDAWGRTLLRVGDTLLVGGDFTGIKPTRFGAVTPSPFLTTLDAVTGQPMTTFQAPIQVDSVVRALALSPDGNQVYVGGDFGFLALDATSGALNFDVSITNGADLGRVFDIAVTQNQVYIGGDFSHVDNTYRANIARLSLVGELDASWNPQVTNGFSAGRSAPVQALAVSPSADKVYVGGNFGFIDGIAVDKTAQNKKISMLAISALDGTVHPERFSADIGGNGKALQVHDVAATNSYVIIAWGGPNYLTFHSLDGQRLRQYSGKGDIQALQIVGNHVFVGHHGEYFGYKNNPIPAEAVESINPDIIVPHKFHSFRIDDPSFELEQAWQITGPFGVWGIAAAEDSIWVAGQISNAGTNSRAVDGLVKFPALD